MSQISGLLIALVVLCTGFTISGSVRAETVLLVPSYVLDVASGERQQDMAVLVEDGRIKAVGAPDVIAKSNIKRISLSGLTLMPGMIDAHSHVLLHPYNETPWGDQVLYETWAERSIRAANHLKATMEAGFTSLRDLGSEGAGYTDVGVRKALEKGVIKGPRLIVAGKAIVATGSYGPAGFDSSHHINLGAEPADGNDLIRVVRDQIGNGADVIKVYADYRWGPNSEARPTFSLQELTLIVDTAASSGRVVVAHASTDEGMRRATIAGVQSIEHGDNGSLATFKLMAEKGVILCPTIAAGDAISQYRGWNKGTDPEPARLQGKRQSLKLAMKAGVIICNGSDVGVFSHGDNAREIELLVDYGLSVKTALQAATIIGADLMGKKGELGEVKPGYLADLIAVEGNPLTDLSALRKVKFVMINGVVNIAP